MSDSVTGMTVSDSTALSVTISVVGASVVVVVVVKRFGLGKAMLLGRLSNRFVLALIFGYTSFNSGFRIKVFFRLNGAVESAKVFGSEGRRYDGFGSEVSNVGPNFGNNGLG